MKNKTPTRCYSNLDFRLNAVDWYHTCGKKVMIMVRPNKGDRQMVATRIPRQDYNKLNRYVELTGTTKNDFIRDVLLERLAEIDLNALNENQGKLPLTA